MEEIQVSVTQLTGAVNSVLDQLRGFETRIVQIEQYGGRNAIESMVKQLDSIGNKIKQMEDRNSIGISTQSSVHKEPLRGPNTESELREIAKLPDPVKEIQVFEGNPTQYVSWVHNIETVLKDYEIVRGKPLYRAILQHIRQKIRGKADAALVSYNIFDGEWEEIKRVLSLHYADKRDIRTLEHQLNSLKQGSSRVDDFYATVNHQFSLIINKIRCEAYSCETADALVGTYRDRALDVFVRGLSGDLSRLLIIQKPKTLPEAYSACLEMQNLNFRNSSVHIQASNMISAPVHYNFNSDKVPSPSGNNFDKYPNTMSRYGQQQLTRFPNNRSSHGQQRNSSWVPSFRSRQSHPPPRPTGPKPPVKMELGSVQTGNVNYMNRPNNPFKREASDSHNYPLKQQRLHHAIADASVNVDEPSTSGSIEAEQEGNFMLGASFPAYHT